MTVFDIKPFFFLLPPTLIAGNPGSSQSIFRNYNNLKLNRMVYEMISGFIWTAAFQMHFTMQVFAPDPSPVVTIHASLSFLYKTKQKKTKA